MNNNSMVEEDWERVYAQEQALLDEERRQAEIRDWERWDIQQIGCIERQPAKLHVVIEPFNNKQYD